MRTLVVIALTLAFAGCGGLTTAEMAKTIKPDLQKQLRDQADDQSLKVVSVDCVKQSKGEATCIAAVSSKSGDQKVSIGVAIDPKTDDAIWRVQ